MPELRDELKDSLAAAIRTAVLQDERDGGGAAKALAARLVIWVARAEKAGLTKDEFLAALPPNLRAWLLLAGDTRQPVWSPPTGPRVATSRRVWDDELEDEDG